MTCFIIIYILSTSYLFLHFTNFLNKTNGQTWITETEEYLYLGYQIWYCSNFYCTIIERFRVSCASMWPIAQQHSFIWHEPEEAQLHLQATQSDEALRIGAGRSPLGLPSAQAPRKKMIPVITNSFLPLVHFLNSFFILILFLISSPFLQFSYYLFHSFFIDIEYYFLEYFSILKKYSKNSILYKIKIL
jgi:hypothetical protein